MSCAVSRVSLPWTTVWSAGTGEVFMPATGWHSTSDVHLVRAVMETLALGTNLNVAFAYQVANVESDPGTVTTPGGYATSNTVTFGSMSDTSSNIGAYQLVRFGWNVKLSSGSTLALGRVGGVVEIKST